MKSSQEPVEDLRFVDNVKTFGQLDKHWLSSLPTYSLVLSFMYFRGKQQQLLIRRGGRSVIHVPLWHGYMKTSHLPNSCSPVFKHQIHSANMCVTWVSCSPITPVLPKLGLLVAGGFPSSQWIEAVVWKSGTQSPTQYADPNTALHCYQECSQYFSPVCTISSLHLNLLTSVRSVKLPRFF